MTFSTITGERDTTAQRSLWNGATPQDRWQESSWGKRIAAIAGVLVPVAITVVTTVIRKKSTDTLMRKVTKTLKKTGVKK